MSGEDKTVRPESRGGRVELRPGPISEELMKPLVFGNHQRHFKVFTAVVSAGQNWGEGELVFIIPRPAYL